MINFKEIVKNFSEYEQIFTDGSKQGERVGAVALFSSGARNLLDYQTNLQYTLQNFVHSS